jgi:uroporphyrin-III C-methyltransferase/precorrin-2 dehydrogenase/sirohydrochlorin ferrochelatase
MGFRYPITLDVDGRRCVVIGGGETAEQKVLALLDAGADVTLVAETPTPHLDELAAQGRIRLLRRPYSAGDLEGAFLAIAATLDTQLNAEIFSEATQRGVLLNAVDDVEHCHFAAPAVVRRGDLAIAISTGGEAPALAKRLRGVLSDQFGPEWGALVDVLAEARARALVDRDVDFDTWAQRWEDALEDDLIGMIGAGLREEAIELVRRTLAGRRPPPATTDAPGHVAIVGAGPGDPDLISVRGKRLLDAADVVVYDRLVHPSLWQGKRAIDAGKKPGAHQVEQDEINALLVRLAGEGNRVVRLKGGDPFVFGRGAEEAEALAAAGVPFEIVPAATSAVAALASAGIPVTDRRWASSVAIATGHCAGGEVHWSRIASAVDTIVVLMGLGHLADIVERLLAAGRAPDTPAAVVESGTLPHQRVVTAELSRLPEEVALAGISSPAVIVVGDVVRVRERIFGAPVAVEEPR